MIAKKRAFWIVEIGPCSDSGQNDVESGNERVVAGDEGAHQPALEVFEKLEEIDEESRRGKWAHASLAGQVRAPAVACDLVTPTRRQRRGDHRLRRGLPGRQIGSSRGRGE